MAEGGIPSSMLLRRTEVKKCALDVFPENTTHAEAQMVRVETEL